MVVLVEVGGTVADVVEVDEMAAGIVVDIGTDVLELVLESNVAIPVGTVVVDEVDDDVVDDVDTGVVVIEPVGSVVELDVLVVVGATVVVVVVVDVDDVVVVVVVVGGLVVVVVVVVGPTPDVSPVTCVGAFRFVVVPSPSHPALLYPQHLTAPVTSSAHECALPVVMAVTPSVSPLTCVGVFRLVVVLSPTCPRLFRPQQFAAPVTSNAQE